MVLIPEKQFSKHFLVGYRPMVRHGECSGSSDFGHGSLSTKRRSTYQEDDDLGSVDPH